MDTSCIKPTMLERAIGSIREIELRPRGDIRKIDGKDTHVYYVAIIPTDTTPIANFENKIVKELTNKVNDNQTYYYWIYEAGVSRFGVDDKLDPPKYGKYWSSNERDFYTDNGIRLIEAKVKGSSASVYLTLEQLLVFLPNEYQCILENGILRVVDNLGFENAFKAENVLEREAVLIDEIYGKQIKFRNPAGKLDNYYAWLGENIESLDKSEMNIRLFKYFSKGFDEGKELSAEQPRIEVIGAKIDGKMLNKEDAIKLLNSRDTKLFIYHDEVYTDVDKLLHCDNEFINCMQPIKNTSQPHMAQSLVCLMRKDGTPIRVPMHVQDYGWEMKPEYKYLEK